MDNNQKETDNGFPARFGQFLKAEKITAGRLATIMTPDGEDPKKNRVKYGRWLSGEASPSYEGVVLIAVRYGLNMNWLMLGHGPMLEKDLQSAVAEVSGDGIDWKTRCLEMESKLNQVIATMTQKYDSLMNEYKALLEKTVRKLDPSLFSESDSQFTVFPTQRNLIGYGRQDNAECIVRMHPATAANLRMLNSRASAVSVEG